MNGIQLLITTRGKPTHNSSHAENWGKKWQVQQPLSPLHQEEMREVVQ
jgi:hypothetical protein